MQLSKIFWKTPLYMVWSILVSRASHYSNGKQNVFSWSHFTFLPIYYSKNKCKPFNFSGFFGLSFVLVVFCSIYFISNVYQKWSQTPIIVTLSSSNTVITRIPFPTVTICNLNKGAIGKTSPVLENAFFIHFIIFFLLSSQKCGSGIFKWPWPKWQRSSQEYLLQWIRQYNRQQSKREELRMEYNAKVFTEYFAAVPWNVEILPLRTGKLRLHEHIWHCLIGWRFVQDASYTPVCILCNSRIWLHLSGICCSFNSVQPKFLYKNPSK